MSSKFLADPIVLNQEGNNVVDQGGQFNQNIDKLYSTLDEMLSSDYLSPAARALGEKIRARKGELLNMAQIINEYGNFCLTSGRTVTNNEQNIIDNYATRV